MRALSPIRSRTCAMPAPWRSPRFERIDSIDARPPHSSDTASRNSRQVRGTSRRMGVLDWFRGGKSRANRHVGEWHRAWSAAAAAPDAAGIVELERGLAALGLPEEEIEIEREMLAG